VGHAERKSVCEQSTLFEHEISTTAVQQLQRVSRNIFSLCEAFLEAEGHHFETLLSNKLS
jgi:hypothetical protein